MKRITITRDENGNVEFETVTVDETENVFFLNLDKQAAHFPSICSNPVGKAPSPPSSQCFPEPEYGCGFHPNEKGIINMPAPAPEFVKPGKPDFVKPGKPHSVKPGKPHFVKPGKPHFVKPGKPG